MNKYIFIDIIGSIPDGLDRAAKIDGYCQPINGFLIKQFAKKVFGLEDKEVRIFAYGDQSNYDIYSHTNNQCYFQLDQRHFYRLNIRSPPGFFYMDFQSIQRELDYFLSVVSDHIVLLFLDDHRLQTLFGIISYFTLYKILMSHPNQIFLIFTDSCFSGLFANIVKWYQIFYNSILTRYEGRKFESNFDWCILESFRELYLFASSKITEGKETIETISNLIDLFTSVSITDNVNLDEIQGLLAKQERGLEITGEAAKFGLKDPCDISNFMGVINSLASNEGFSDLYSKYKRCVTIFTRDNFDLFKAMSNEDYSEYMDMIKIFKSMNVDFKLKPHPNIKVITSTDRHSESIPFPSIRVNESIKVYPGTPFISTLIKEIFMKLDDKPMEFERIIKEISFDGSNIIEYSARYYRENGICQKEWIQLKPQIYETGKAIELSFKPTKRFLENIQKLRVISYITSNKLQEIAKTIIPNASPDIPNFENNIYGDIVALTAAMQTFSKETQFEELLECFSLNRLLDFDEAVGTKQLTGIINAAFKLSKDPIRTVSITMNCIHKILSVVSNEYHKSIFTLINSAEFFGFGFIIASLITKENSVPEVIDIVGTSFGSDLKSNPIILKLLEDIETKKIEENKIKIVEKYMYEYGKSALGYLDKLGEIHKYINVNTPALRSIRKEISALTTLIQINYDLSTEITQRTEKYIFEVLESVPVVYHANKMAYPAILGAMNLKSALKAMAIAMYTDDEAFQKPKYTKENDMEFKKIFNETLQLLPPQLHESIFDEERKEFGMNFISQLKNEIKNEANEASRKVWRLSIYLKKSTIMNIGRRMPINVIRNAATLAALIDRIVPSSAIKLYENVQFIKNEIDLMINQLEFKCKIEDSREDCKLPNPITFESMDLYVSAAEELLTISTNLSFISQEHIPSIMEDVKEMKESKNIIQEVVINMLLARANFIPEMSPLVKSLSDIRVKSVAEKPINEDEIMATVTGTRHYLSGKDLSRERIRIRDPNSAEHQIIDPNFPFGRGLQQSSNSPAASLAFSSPMSYPRSSYENSSCTEINSFCRRRNPFQVTKDYGGKIDPEGIEKLNVGNSIWFLDAWNVFVYRFNERIKELGLMFDPEHKYEGIEICISDAFNKVMEFYPISRIRVYPRYEKNLCCFFGENKKYYKQLCDAYVKAFDDTDRMVTPYYFDRTTFTRDPDCSFRW